MTNDDRRPSLRWDEYSLQGTIQLPVWRLFHAAEEVMADSGAHLNVETTGDSARQITDDQLAAYRFTLDHQVDLQQKIIAAVFTHYVEERAAHGKEFEALGWPMPEVHDVNDLTEMIMLNYVHLSDVSKSGIAYVGYEFECTWEQEHGLGVLTHGDRVEEVGPADTAFTSWIAQQKAGESSNSGT